MATYHILNGDCLAEQLLQTTINPDFIVCRECLIDGAVKADSIVEFWSIRAQFISGTYKVSTEEYYSKSVAEFDKLDTLPEHSEVCLWFENDLFCQANMWFIISLLASKPSLKLYRIFPDIENQEDTWKGFGISNSEQLEKAYVSKIQFTADDIELGKNLWEAYQQADFDRLRQLSRSKSACFDYLEEVCEAHIDRFPVNESLGRPIKLVKELIETHGNDFRCVFMEFSKREGIYGFGDLQVKEMYDKLIHEA